MPLYECVEFLFDFRNMAMLPDLVGLQRFMRFGKMIGQRRTAAGAGDAGLRVDDDRLRLHEVLGEQRRQL